MQSALHMGHVFFSFSHSFDDVFGMFGKSRTPWWQKQNVCIKREVLEEDDEETLSEKSFDDDGNTEEQKIDIPTVIKVTGVDNRGDDGNGETVEWSFFDDDDSSLCYSTDTNENSDDEDEDDDENENGENNNEELIVPTEDHEMSIPSVFEVAIDIPPPVAVEAVRPLRRSSRNRKKPVRFVDEYTRYY